MDIKILVATHKKYWMPDDKVYVPLHVGREGKQDLGYIGDNTGDNISSKNANYCELTGLYWAWKNLDCEYIGLCHYRRYFGKIGRWNKYVRSEKERILSREELEVLLEDSDIILPEKYSFNDSTVGKQYEQAHKWQDMLEVRKIISEMYPEYLKSFDDTMNSSEAHFLNMFVTKKVIFSEYCEWLFSILFELEKRIDISLYDSYQSRIYGFLSERLFNVWLRKANLKVKCVAIINLEGNVKERYKITRKIAKFFRI